MSKRAPALGIDLGTTYSCMAYIDESDRPVVLKNYEGENTTPSVVAFDGENVSVGRDAKQSAVANPHGTVSFAKRFMGKPHRFEMESGSYSPEEISAAILRKMVADASTALGEKITDVAITVPAYFGIPEREATKKAGEIAGLNVLCIIPEPIAAAYSYRDTDVEKTLLVFDLGGGTFDVTVIEVTPKSFKTIVVNGDHELGGKDWDERVVRHLVAKFCEQSGSDPDELFSDLETMADFQDTAERVVKKTLSSRDSVKTSIGHAGVRQTVTITREEFDQITIDLVERTIHLTKSALEEAAKKGVTKIDEILLVGGSTKMPQVAAAIRREFNQEPRFHDPDEAVAKGAALVARNTSLLSRIEEELGISLGEGEKLSPENEKKLESFAQAENMDMMGLMGTLSKQYTTVCSKSFGLVSVEMPSRNEKVANLIVTNTDLPATREQTFATVDDGQTSVSLRIMENVIGDARAEVHESKELGKGILDFGKPMPEGTPVQVMFTMKADGTLDIEASEPTTGQVLKVTLETANVIQGEELEEARKRSGGLRF